MVKDGNSVEKVNHITSLFDQDSLKHIPEGKWIMAGDWNIVENLSLDTYSINDNGTRNNNNNGDAAYY